MFRRRGREGREAGMAAHRKGPANWKSPAGSHSGGTLKAQTTFRVVLRVFVPIATPKEGEAQKAL